jgi:ubiquinone/menaquinone biosynthesis C-methylase UbiE
MMRRDVVNSYENYHEEERLSTNNARKIEFLTTTRILNEVIYRNSDILDCAAGTGIYAFYLADQGHRVTATDITPRHIDYIRSKLKTKNYGMHTAVLDATNMGIFPDESFDVVLNMGPFYHLTNPEDREKCMRESIRVLRHGGILVTAYIPRYFVFQYVALRNKQLLNASLANKLIKTGTIKADDEQCFWTDTHYASCDEMEVMYERHQMEIIEHFAQDGVSPLVSSEVDAMTADEFSVWCDYHYSICRERTLLGASNHTVIIGKKL